MTDPKDLLPEDQYLLGVDPEDLMNASPDGRQAWMSNLESAVAAADHAKRKRDDLLKMMQLNLNQLTSKLRMKKNDVYIELVLDGGIIFDVKEYTDGSPSTSLGNTNWNPILSLKILMIENKLMNL